MPTRRQVISGLLGGLAAGAVRGGTPAVVSAGNSGILRIAFGSCVSQRKDQTVWKQIASKRPHLFVMMGDGIYPEHEGADLPVLDAIEKAYIQASARCDLAEFREQVETIAIWDDNDYGGSDIGAVFEHKCRSRDLFLKFWASPEEQEARRRNSGIYALWEMGPPGIRTQIILLDLRFCRSEWAQTEDGYRQALSESGYGPYRQTSDDGITMLGETQWAWLESCLNKPARLRVLVSSIQLAAEGRGWESWSNFPGEKQRLLSLIRSTDAQGVVVLSGDTHYAEVSRQDDSSLGYPLWEFTSSGLTEFWPTPGPNPNRVGAAYPETNFGLLTVNWHADRPMIVAEIFGAHGRRLRQESIMLDTLSRNS
jgi:alkaline phosphatase D